MHRLGVSLMALVCVLVFLLPLALIVVDSFNAGGLE